MALTVTLLGSSYSIPEPGDVGYDQQLTNYLKALATAFPQLNGGTQSLTAELDFGASFGIKSLYLKSRTANVAAAGQVRLASTDTVSFRNNANGADVALAKDTADALTWGGAYVTGLPMLSATTAAGQSIPTGATPTTVVFGTVDRDSDSAYNSSTGRYTVPTGKGGDYVITGEVAYASAPTGTCALAIAKNGTVIKQFSAIAPAINQSIAVSGILNLAAGDIIDLRTFHGNGGSQSLNTTAANNYFALKRIPT